jgi:hypothetical protein
MLKSIWRFCGNVRLTFWFLSLISCTLAGGSYYIKYYPQVFRPLNRVLFQEWFKIYGQEYPDRIWWVWVLFGLLVALGINTVVCTTDRLYSLWSKRKQMDFKVFFLKVTPSLIHICFLIMLSGHLIGMISGFNLSMDVVPGEKTSLPIQTNIRVLDQNCDYYNSPELLKGFVKQCSVSLELEAQGKKTFKQIRFLDPLFWQGYSFHLLIDKKTNTPKIKLIIKNDPGRKLIMSGFVFLVLLMLWYFTQIDKGNKRE